MEIWKPVPGFEGLYEVSNLGRIGSLRYSDERRILKPNHAGRLGHPQAQFRVNGKRHCLYVSRLVLEVFVGPSPEGYEAHHKNGNPKDNRVENLVWLSHAEHVRATTKDMAYRHGTNHPMSLLIDADVKAIRAMYATGRFTHQEIAELFPVGWGAIRSICQGENWKHIASTPVTRPG